MAHDHTRDVQAPTPPVSPSASVTSAEGSPARARKPYTSPVLTRHGRIATLTRSGGATRREGFFLRRRPQ